jgi:hypothetical protein
VCVPRLNPNTHVILGHKEAVSVSSVFTTPNRPRNVPKGSLSSGPLYQSTTTYIARIMDATFLRAPFSGPETALQSLPMNYPAFMQLPMDPNAFETSKRRKVDPSNIKQEPGLTQSGETSNPPAVTSVPGMPEMPSVRVHLHEHLSFIVFIFSRGPESQYLNSQPRLSLAVVLQVFFSSSLLCAASWFVFVLALPTKVCSPRVPSTCAEYNPISLFPPSNIIIYLIRKVTEFSSDGVCIQRLSRATPKRSPKKKKRCPFSLVLSLTDGCLACFLPMSFILTPQYTTLPAYAHAAMYPVQMNHYAASAYDPRVAFFMQQQQQLAAIQRMGMFNPQMHPAYAAHMMPMAMPVFHQQQPPVPMPQSQNQTTNSNRATSGPVSAARGDDDTPSKRRGQKRRIGQITKSNGAGAGDEEDLDGASMLLTGMSTGNSPSSAPTSPERKDSHSSLSHDATERRRSRRPALSVDVESPSDAGSVEIPSSPSATSPTSPDSFEEKYDTENPFHSPSSAGHVPRLRFLRYSGLIILTLFYSDWLLQKEGISYLSRMRQGFLPGLLLEGSHEYPCWNPTVRLL